MILTGTAVLTALGRTCKPVELRDSAGIRVSVLGTAEVYAYLDTGRYEAHGQKRRVRYIKPASPIAPRRPNLPWQSCWLTEMSSVIRFHGSQFSAGIVTTEWP